MHEAAYLIQGYFRIKHLSCVFQKMRQAAVIIQRRFGKIFPRRKEQKKQYDQQLEILGGDRFILDQKWVKKQIMIQHQLRIGIINLTKNIFFAFIIDMEIISDTSYNGSFASNYKDLFIQSFEKENPLQYIQIGENTTIRTCCNKMYGWGLNDMSLLGSTQDGEKHNSTQMNFIGKIKTISMGQNHCLLQQNDNKLFIWVYVHHKFIQFPKLLHENVEFKKAYRNRILYILQGKVYDQLKYIMDKMRKDQVERLPLNEKIIQIECGFKHVIALSSLKKVFVWEYNEFGQLGTGINKPKQLQINGDQVMAGMKCSCVLNKQLFWCGTNQFLCNYLNRKEYQIVKVLNSYSNNISVLYCTYACLRGLFDNNLGRCYKQLNNQQQIGYNMESVRLISLY